MLEYITIVISSLLAIIGASLNTQKNKQGENKTVFKKPNKIGVIVIGLLVVLSISQFVLKKKQHKAQKEKLVQVQTEKERELQNMAELLRRSKEDSISLTRQIQQLDTQKRQLSNQIKLSEELVSTQKFAIDKTAEYNTSLKNELEKQKHALLPLRLLFTIEIDGKDIVKEVGYKKSIDSILNSYTSGDTNSSYHITENYDNSHNISISDSEYMPESLRFAHLNIGFYKSINKESIKSIVFQWDTTLLRLSFRELNILSYRTNSSNYKTDIYYETSKSGRVMSENRKIYSSLELNNLFLNVHFPYRNFEIKKITLISGKQNEEIYKKMKLKEVFKDQYNPDNGKWYTIEIAE